MEAMVSAPLGSRAMIGCSGYLHFPRVRHHWPHFAPAGWLCGRCLGTALMAACFLGPLIRLLERRILFLA